MIGGCCRSRALTISTSQSLLSLGKKKVKISQASISIIHFPGTFNTLQYHPFTAQDMKLSSVHVASTPGYKDSVYRPYRLWILDAVMCGPSPSQRKLLLLRANGQCSISTKYEMNRSKGSIADFLTDNRIFAVQKTTVNNVDRGGPWLAHARSSKSAARICRQTHIIHYSDPVLSRISSPCPGAYNCFKRRLEKPNRREQSEAEKSCLLGAFPRNITLKIQRTPHSESHWGKNKPAGYHYVDKRNGQLLHSEVGESSNGT